ncbi:hypothetical protein POJ06DRAFT_257348 [Lipomyces tetrasporus]|uniref:EthD domain-containing protein n=1 Tax=Lipomyces tetrasporus TaxID=54092 RepID=A0AAD7QRP1_9ASCO|nr:uncharacterized protein POJ06DRAFT_257348 [Lipomyces tetrasporus]KAJ8098552.1 hypothetical protein POJ06DRAFT_257348 [Lipomyces tetrasporus]
MTFNLTILYPNQDDIKFDMHYYLHTHMPLVERGWRSAGVLKWEVIEFGPRADSQKPPYRIANIMTWKDETSYTAASTGPTSWEYFEDIPQFSNRQPIFVSGKVVASG